MISFFEAAMFSIGCWYTFWTVLALFTPTKAKRMRKNIWDQVGAFCDKIGWQIKNEKEE